MIDRSDRDITAGAGCRGQRDRDGKYEKPLPFRSRPRCACWAKRHGWRCWHLHAVSWLILRLLGCWYRPRHAGKCILVTRTCL